MPAEHMQKWRRLVADIARVPFGRIALRLDRAWPAAEHRRRSADQHDRIESAQDDMRTHPAKLGAEHEAREPRRKVEAGGHRAPPSSRAK